MSEGVPTRRLAAVLAADVVGYSALVAADEDGTLARLRALFREVVQPAVAAERGRIFKLMGDAFLAEFPSAAGALRCAMALQEQVAAREAADLRLRIGIHLGDVVVQGSDLLGDGVNVAARLEGVATPGGIVVSGAVAEAVCGRVPLEDLGEQALKNLGRAVRVFRVATGEAPQRPAPALPDKPSLVVLPFQNMSGDAEQDYFADGMVEDITTALSRIRWLFVIARNTAFAYKGRALDLREVGRELGVRYILEGSVRRSGERLRIVVQLIEAASGHHLWADRFDGRLDEVFELQDAVTEAVAGAIEPTLRSSETDRMRAKPTENLAAYDCYLRGREYFQSPAFFSRDTTCSDAAVEWLRKAVRLDPHYALARGMLALVSYMRSVAGFASGQEIADAVTHASACLASGSDDAEAIASAAHALAFLSSDVAPALRAIDDALRLNPNSARVLASVGWVLSAAGRGTEALACFDKAERISPLEPSRARRAGARSVAHLVADQLEEAERLARTCLGVLPGWNLPYRVLIAALGLQGRKAEAAEWVAKLSTVTPDYRISTDPLLNVLRKTQPATAISIASALRLAGLPPD